MFKLVRKTEEGPLRRVCILGVGDAGCRALEGVLGSSSGAVAAINTDAVGLSKSNAATKLQIGQRAGADGGTGGEALLGKAAAENDIEMIRGLLTDCDAIVAVAGLGGGTGTGALPVVLSAARASGVLALAVVTTPFSFEGTRREQTAQEGLKAVAAGSDFSAVITNDRLFSAAGSEGNLKEAFAHSDAALAAGIWSLWHMLVQPALLSVDAGTFRALGAKGCNACLFGFGMAGGAGRAQKSVKMLLEGPAFDQGSLLRSGGAALVCISGSYDLTLQEVSDTVEALREALPSDGDLHIGAVINDAWRDWFFVTVYLADRRRSVTVVRREGGGGRRKSDPQVATRKSSRSRGAQAELKFDDLGVRGRFNNVAATFLDGEDLDTPTFMRRGIVLEK